ncbi:MAG TPA: MarR family transcriptional regulator [Actinomycetota bacterium]|nr:MarR family transcriptional regulator [Actinomycetota bacterium]
MSEGPSWDAGDAGVAQVVWGQILDLAMHHRRRFFEVLSDFGFTFGDFRALVVMEPGQPMPMGSLAQVWECDASNATWVVDRLEERGLVERRTLPTDRRVKTVVLTDIGVKTKAELFAALYRPPAEFLELDPERLEALKAALESLPPSMLGGGCPIPASLRPF